MIEKSFLVPLLLGATFAAILLAGCGSGKAAHTTTAGKRQRARSTTIRVFLERAATRAQERSVDERLRGEPCVRRVVFVSKAQALKLMKKKFPALFKAVQPLAGANPLPASFTVTARRLTCVPGIGGQVAHWPGVDTVKWRT